MGGVEEEPSLSPPPPPKKHRSQKASGAGPGAERQDPNSNGARAERKSETKGELRFTVPFSPEDGEDDGCAADFFGNGGAL